MKLIALIIAVLFLLGPLWTPRLAPNSYEGGRSRNVHDRMIRNSSAVAMILGEARASTSDLLFIKTERYLDHGVAFEPHLDREILSVSGEARQIDHVETDAAAHDEQEQDHDHEDDHGHEHDHAEGAPPQTIIRTVERDFRGFIGELERRVQPWRDPNLAHEHATGEELLPWFRIMTMADPHNARAYAIGGWWLKHKDREAAIAFVEEGLRHNPDSFQLHFTRGTMIFEKARELIWSEENRKEGEESPPVPPEATALIEQAKASCARAAELGLARRPKGWLPEDEEKADTDDTAWTLYEDEDARAAARFVVLLERHYGDKRRAIELAREFSARLDGDGILEKQIPLIEKQLDDTDTKKEQKKK